MQQRHERRNLLVGHLVMMVATLGAFYAAQLPSLVARLLAAALVSATVWAVYVAGALAYLRLVGATITDPLTGLYNRRYLLERLQEETARAVRYRTPLAVAVVDIDAFKQYNDRHGHLAGDRVLHALSTAILHTLRRTDMGFRFGGEEFVLLMPGTGLREASYALQRLARADLPIGFSAGIATCPDEAQDAVALLHLADMRLLQAKAAGKGQIHAGTAGVYPLHPLQRG